MEPALRDAESFRAAASTLGLDRRIKILPLPAAIPTELSTGAIQGMVRLRDLTALTALRGGRATDLPRPAAGKGHADTLVRGRSEPATEPDLVLALDTIESGYHEGLYRPELPFFEDRGPG